MCVLRKIIKDYRLTCTELTIMDLADETSFDFDKWYQSIRGADWPDCKNEEDLYKLPQWIKSECIRFGYKFIDSDVNIS